MCNFIKSVNWAIIIPAFIMVIGWPIIHFFNSRNAYKNKLRDIRTEYLITTYQKLANASQRPPTEDSPYFSDMESVIADIQLFGSRAQITKINTAIAEFKKTNNLELDPILNDLRNSLRKELQLSDINDNVEWIRFEGAPPSKSHL
ncbi:MAG: hypothetical protein GY951_18340 [Psychromonas sp.]|nr:hypothetical protein [Psychromonas sp.]